MSEQLVPINSLANNTVTTLIALANNIVNTMATTMVTANGSANGALTNGNGYISGIFGSSVLVTGLLRGGNVAASANLVIGSNTFVNSSILTVGNTTVNSTMNATSISSQVGAFTNASFQYLPQSNVSFANCTISETDTVTSGTATVNVDSWTISTFRTAEYLIQVVDNAANNFQSSKLIVTHNGVTPIWDEYSILTTNTTIATFAAVANSTTVSLQATPVSTNTTIRTVRTTLKA